MTDREVDMSPHYVTPEINMTDPKHFCMSFPPPSQVACYRTVYYKLKLQ